MRQYVNPRHSRRVNATTKNMATATRPPKQTAKMLAGLVLLATIGAAAFGLSQDKLPTPPAPPALPKAPEAPEPQSPADSKADRPKPLPITDIPIAPKSRTITTKADIEAINWGLEAVEAALADLLSLPEADRPFQRYVLCRNANPHVTQIVVNMSMLRTSEPVFPAVALESKLLRYDLRKFADQDKVVAELVEIWEELRFDPYFSQDTRVVVDTSKKGVVAEITVTGGAVLVNDKGERYQVPRGEMVKIIGKTDNATTRVDYRGIQGSIKATDIANVPAKFKADVIPALHAGGAINLDGPANKLSELTRIPGLLDAGSRAVVVDSRYLEARMFSSEDLGIGEPLYYRFRGIPVAKGDEKKTDFQLLADQLGVRLDLAAKGEAANAAALSISKVTGRQRQIFVIRSRAQQPARGQSLFWYTLDPAINRRGSQFDPLRNLSGMEFDASEVIFDLESGLQGYALYDKNGKLQSRAPDVVVTDNTVPKPHQANLVSGRSCFVCHGVDDGVIGFKNQIPRLTASGLDLLGDLGIKDQIAAISAFVRLYNWNPEVEVIPSARRAFATAVFRATKVESKKVVSDFTADFDSYVYGDVTAKDALFDLGVAVGDNDPSAVFSLVIPREKPADFKSVVQATDPVLELLRIGEAITRPQWELIYPEAASRAVAAGIYKRLAVKAK